MLRQEKNVLKKQKRQEKNVLEKLERPAQGPAQDLAQDLAQGHAQDLAQGPAQDLAQGPAQDVVGEVQEEYSARKSTSCWWMGRRMHMPKYTLGIILIVVDHWHVWLAKVGRVIEKVESGLTGK